MVDNEAPLAMGLRRDSLKIRNPNVINHAASNFSFVFLVFFFCLVLFSTNKTHVLVIQVFA